MSMTQFVSGLGILSGIILLVMALWLSSMSVNHDQRTSSRYMVGMGVFLFFISLLIYLMEL